MKLYFQINQKSIHTSTDGYTLIEIVTIVAIIGILSAIIAPSWLSFVERQRLNTAQNQVYRAMQEAKSNALRDKITWQVSFRKVIVNGKQVSQFAIHPAHSEQFIPDSVLNNNSLWYNFDSNINIDDTKNNKGKDETSLIKQTELGPWRAQFNHYGCPVSKPQHQCGQTSITAKGRLTLLSKNGGKLRRCVIISTLLGAMRTGEEHATPDDTDKYCY